MKKTNFDLLIVEDEQEHLQHLQSLLTANHPDFKLLPPCTSGQQAVSYLKHHTPGLVFFDIDLGGLNAFDVLKQLPNRDFEVIFTTAYNEFALEAFRIHAADYLLKPIVANELADAIERVVNRPHMAPVSSDLVMDEFERLSKRYLTIHEKQRVKYIPLAEIIYLEASRNYTIVHFLDKGILQKTTATGCLSVYEPQLMRNDFLRIHQSYIVNASEIREFDKTNSTLRLASGISLPVARGRRGVFDK